MATYFEKYAAGQRRFWYLDGLTSDECYPDSGMQLDLNQLLYQELHQAGYEKIVFYNARKRLYCYDDASYALLLGKSPEPAPQSAPRRNGLKMGAWERSGVTTGTTAAAPFRGEKSGVLMAAMADTPLHAGMQANDAILRQFLAMLKDESHPTVIVIDDADHFLRELSRTGDWASFFREVTVLPSSNENIMVFLFPDAEHGGLLQLESMTRDPAVLRSLNLIPVGEPDAREYANMLHHFRLLYSLKIRVSEIPDIAREISRCIEKISQDEHGSGIASGVRIKMLYAFLKAFAASGERLTVENCHTLFRNASLGRIPTARELLSDLIGMEAVKSQILGKYGHLTDSDPRGRLEQCPENRIKPAPRSVKRSDFMHIVLTGDPGTGKTTVARLLGQFFAEAGLLRTGHVVETDRQGLVAGYVGQTAIKTREMVTRALGGVLFIDEAYAITQNEQDAFGQECIDTLVKAMDEYKDDLIVVAAGYPVEMEQFLQANPGLMRRFRERIHIPDYTPAELTEILRRNLQSRGLRLEDTLQSRMPGFFESWKADAAENWGNVGEAVKLAADLETAYLRSGNRNSLIGEDLLPERYRPYLVPLEEVRGNAVEDILQMPGLSSVKKRIREIENALIVGNLGEPGHYFFIGAPGTGKTTVARKMGVLFRTHHLLRRGHLIETNANALISAGVDATVSRALDGVLFIDEAYQLMNSAQGRDIVDSLVKYMEDERARISIIFAGYEAEMDEMRRTANTGLESRVKCLYFDNYTGEELFAILQTMLPGAGLRADADFLEYSRRVLVRYTGRQQKNPRFGNARYVRRDYLETARSCMNARLVAKYGAAIPDAERNLLTGADIPESLQRFAKRPLPAPDTRSLMEKLDDLVGFAGIKAYLRDLLEQHKFQQSDTSGAQEMALNLNLLLKGNPGTGKTTIANLIGEVYKECGLLPGGRTFKVDRSDLVAGYVGQTAEKTRRCIEKAMGNVLFIDEAYALTDAGSPQDFGAEAVTTLVAAMTDHMGEFAVIAAGYPDRMEQFLRSNPGLNGRFREFTIEDYTPAELAQIFRRMCAEYGFGIDEMLDAKLEGFFAALRAYKPPSEPWQNARECEILCRDMQALWLRDRVTRGEQRVYTEAHIPAEKRRFLA